MARTELGSSVLGESILAIDDKECDLRRVAHEAQKYTEPQDALDKQFLRARLDPGEAVMPVGSAPGGGGTAGEEKMRRTVP